MQESKARIYAPLYTGCLILENIDAKTIVSAQDLNKWKLWSGFINKIKRPNARGIKKHVVLAQQLLKNNSYSRKL
jgi:hypothetical protein